MSNNLRVIRAKHRINQHTLAAKAKICQTRISLMENDFYRPKPGEKIRIAKVLGVKIEEIWPQAVGG